MEAKLLQLPAFGKHREHILQVTALVSQQFFHQVIDMCPWGGTVNLQYHSYNSSSCSILGHLFKRSPGLKRPKPDAHPEVCYIPCASAFITSMLATLRNNQNQTQLCVKEAHSPHLTHINTCTVSTSASTRKALAQVLYTCLYPTHYHPGDVVV